MTDLLKNLAQLQSLELEESQDATSETLVQELRTKIPAQILGHYDRLMARGKKGIVPLRGQTCSGCNMRVPIAVVSTLMKGADIQLCDSCGRYLHLPESTGTEAVAQDAEVKAAAKRGKKKAKAKKD